MYIDKEKMETDKVFSKQKCLSVFLKRDPEEMEDAFFMLAKDSECDEKLYETNYYKDIDDTMKKVATFYSENLRKLFFSLPSEISASKCLKVYVHYELE